MDNLRRIIKTLFCDSNSEDILQSNTISHNKTNYASQVTEDWLTDVLDDKQTGYTKDEIRYLNNVTNDSWLHYPNKQKLRKSVFNTLLHFTDKVLCEENDEPICIFSNLLRWRELSYLMGEDIFTIAYLANKDLGINRERNYFSWRPVIENDNKILKEILSRGISELHFHLWGSAFVAEINWISLMNDITERKTQFKGLRNSKSPNKSYGFDSNTPLPLHERCIKAAALRAYLFVRSRKIQFEKEKIKKLEEIIYLRTPQEIKIVIPELQSIILCLRYEFGYLFDKDALDYGISKSITEKDAVKDHKSNLILAGERRLLYDSFKKVYNDSDKDNKFCIDPDFETALYAYLIIKNDFRKEIIQVNERIGFANFAEYQDRKDFFIKPDTIYEKIAGPTAILSTMSDQKIDYLEARITPKDSISELSSSIEKTDKVINSKLFKNNISYIKCRVCHKNINLCIEAPKIFNPNYYYILHFIKRNYKEDKTKDDFILSRKPRNYKLREVVKQQAKVFNKIRKSHGNIKKRIAGIDAASSEIGYRPELFAQAFRYLKNYSYRFPEEFIINSTFNKIGFTFHAGEDYLDIADGLRAIDETIKFLNFKSGDRIGHAIALGIDAFQYYNQKNYTLIMPKQDYIDNIVWILNKIKEYNIDCPSKLYRELHSEYKRVYYEIYQKTAIDLDVYYQSWLLRGDDPYLYYDINIESFNNTAFTFWDKCGVNNFVSEIDTARKNKNVRLMIKKYHFDSNAKKRGAECAEFEVYEGYDKLIDELQHKLRMELASMHIAIECNPTSNQVIGTYKRYAKHPIFKFNNHRLYNDPDKHRNNPQLSVSLNTDDQGVFSTYLENEYALMAIALEKEVDENGNRIHNSRFIYEYLDSLRLMGHEQRFVK